MARIKEDNIKMIILDVFFYDIPRVRHMIAARQMNFIGKVVQGPHNCSAQHITHADSMLRQCLTDWKANPS